MVREQLERRVDTNSGDQYSLPTCSSHIDSLGCCELGRGTTELLGVLRALEDNNTGLESAWR